MSKVGGVVKNLGLGAARRLPSVLAPRIPGTLVRLIDAAIDGVGKLPPAKRTAARHLERKQSVEAAIASITRVHIALASAQGFVTNLGGIVAAVVGVPANAAGIVIVEIRMAACIAHLNGYDIDDPRVRTALVMCLLGDKELHHRIRRGDLPTTPLAVATAPMYEPALAERVVERVLSEALLAAGGKDVTRIVMRRVPLVGGGIAAVTDGLETRLIAACVRHELVPRRLLPPGDGLSAP